MLGMPGAQKGSGGRVCLASDVWPRLPVIGGSGEDQAVEASMPTLSSSCRAAQGDNQSSGPDQPTPVGTSDVDLEETASGSGPEPCQASSSSGWGPVGRLFRGCLAHSVPLGQHGRHWHA